MESTDTTNMSPPPSIIELAAALLSRYRPLIDNYRFSWSSPHFIYYQIINWGNTGHSRVNLALNF